MKRIRYIVKYKKGSKQKQVTGFVRIPKDLPENFLSNQLIDWLSEKHNTENAELEITLKNYVSKNFRYGNTIG